jgi:ornithine cyclodeaminase/alanine dehydrogenase-like protein (mu-crystallin family)
MDYGILNSLRVGATAGVAARYLAPPGARSVGLLGSGWQAQPQLDALRHAVPTLEHVRVFSPTPAHRAAFAEQMTLRLDIPVEPCDSVEAAIRDADIVDLCAPGHFDVREPLFDPAWIRPGALVISMAQNQYRPELAEHARLVGSSSFPEDPGTPLKSILLGSAPAREHPGQTVVYQLEGGTVQDLFVAMWGYDWARARGLGQPFDLSA